MQPLTVPPDDSRRDEKADQHWGSINGRVLSERFLILDDLTGVSSGSAFTVHLVKDLREFCRKVILRSVPAPPDDLVNHGPSFLQVCEVIKRLNHPAIEVVLETGRLFDGRPYGVFEHYAGCALNYAAGDGVRFELSRVARIVEQTSEALAAAHAKGILHCDLNPSNILLTNDGGTEAVRLINFGSAWPIDSRGERLARLDMNSESLYYAAPELHSALGHRSPASDVFSLAVLCYRLMTGKLPFTGGDRKSLIEAISAGAFDRPIEVRTDVSLKTENLLLAALQFEPALRPQDIGEFGSRLAESLRPMPAGLPGVAAPEIERIAADPPGREVVETVQLAEVDEVSFAYSPARVRRVPQAAVSDRAIAWAMIILLLAGALSIPVAQNLFQESKTSAAVETMVQRPTTETTRHRLKIWTGSEPGDAEGRSRRGADSAGRTLAFNFVADSAGYAYLFKEFTDADGGTNYQVIHPAPSADAALEGGKEARAATSASDGTKAIWLVWTASKNEDLDALTDSAADAVVTELAGRKLRHFLERNRNMRLTVTAAGGQTYLDGLSDRIVYRFDAENGS